MEIMNFIIGFFAGLVLMFGIAISIRTEWKKDIEKLKDFDTWKQWKNKSE
jgi:hypothetical protein